MYQPKIIKCRLHTGGKSIEQIKDRYKGQNLTYRNFENIQKANAEFDGVVLLLSLWDYDNFSTYHLYGWDDDVDDKMMMGIYYAEQTHPFPRYLNNLKQFKEDWKTNEYDPGCSFGFDPQDVEEIEIVREEGKEETKSYEKKQEKHKKPKPKKKRRNR